MKKENDEDAGQCDGRLFVRNTGDALGMVLAEALNRPDRRPDNTGLDDGPPLPSARRYIKRSAGKTSDEVAEIRAKAWETRRAKYGERGHR